MSDVDGALLLIRVTLGGVMLALSWRPARQA